MNDNFYDNHPEFPPYWDDKPITEDWIAQSMDETFDGEYLSFGDRMCLTTDHARMMLADNAYDLTPLDVYGILVHFWHVGGDWTAMIEDFRTFLSD